MIIQDNTLTDFAVMSTKIDISNKEMITKTIPNTCNSTETAYKLSVMSARGNTIKIVKIFPTLKSISLEFVFGKQAENLKILKPPCKAGQLLMCCE